MIEDPEVDVDAYQYGPHPLPLFLMLLFRHLGKTPDRLQTALEGLRRYHQAKRLPPQTEFPIIAKRGGVSLRLVAKINSLTKNAPFLVVIPSLINSPRILDLTPQRSLVRHLSAQGHKVILVDWGPNGASERRLGMSGLITTRLLPLLSRLDGPIQLLGYCLGGTLAIGAAHLLGDRLDKLALLATPWHFSKRDKANDTELAKLVSTLETFAKTLGAAPTSALNPLFWALDETGVVSKFEELGRSCDVEKISWFATVEDWASSGAPLSLTTVRDVFIRGYQQDMFGNGRWRLSGQTICPYSLTRPLGDFGSAQDKIVLPQMRIEGPNVYKHQTSSGHVGLVIGTAAKQDLWEPLSNWLHHG